MSTEERFLLRVMDMVGLSQAGPDDTLYDVAKDSLDQATILDQLEEDLHVSLPNEFRREMNPRTLTMRQLCAAFDDARLAQLEKSSA